MITSQNNSGVSPPVGRSNVEDNVEEGRGGDTSSESSTLYVDNNSFRSISRQASGADLESIAIANVWEDDRQGGSHLTQGEVGLKTLLKRFILLGYPLSISVLAQFSMNAAILAVVGRYIGVVEMGGASLALGMVNATGFAFGSGLCGAMETVLSQTYGKFMQRKRLGELGPDATVPMYGIYAQRMVIILLIAAIPLGIVLCFTDTLLTAVGESPEVTYYTGVFCRIAVLGVPLAMGFQLVQRYYSCQHVTKPLSVTMVSGAIVNPILQIVLVKMFGFVGSAIGWLLLFFGINASLLAYLRYTGLYKLTWGGWCRKGMKNIKPLAKIALPSMGVMMSEWVALEINFLAAGFATPNELAAYSITYQVFGFVWGFASGIIVLTSVFVGNAIGEGKPLLARRLAFMTILLVFCVTIVNGILLFLVNPYLPYLFTKDPEVADIYRRLMYIVLPYQMVDGFQSVVMGILRGCGLQKVGVVIITTAFCVVGVPLSFILFFHFEIGVKALWIGPFTGASCVGVPSYLYLLFRYIDWENLKAQTEGGPGADPVVAAPSQEVGEPTPSVGVHQSETNVSKSVVVMDS